MTARSEQGEQAGSLVVLSRASVPDGSPRADTPCNDDREVSEALEAVNRVADTFGVGARDRMRADIIATYSIIQRRG